MSMLDDKYKMKSVVSQKLSKDRRKFGNKMIYSSKKKQEMTNCSEEIKTLTRDQMMLGGYIYDNFSWLRDSVFCLLR